MPITPGSALYHCLYADEDGEIADLYEVQLIEPIPLDRVPTLRQALESDDLIEVYQATCVLAAWADPVGLDRLDKLIESAEDMRNAGLDPDRVYGEDNCFDGLAQAAKLSVLNGNSIAAVNRVFKKLLKLYPNWYFKGNLKAALIEHAEISLLHDIETALEQTRQAGKIYQASQLVPVVAKLDSTTGWQIAQSFRHISGVQPDPLSNVAEAMGYINTAQSRALLDELVQHSVTAVAYAAKEATARLEIV